jgi:hypothetical protein
LILDLILDLILEPTQVNYLSVPHSLVGSWP